jgi:ABC-type transporter Mla subunit MlaD
VPGEYTVTLRAGGREFTKPVRVMPDPRVQVAQADYEAQLAAALELRDLVSQVNQVVDRMEDLKRQLGGLIENLGKTAAAAADGGNGSTGPSSDTALVAAARAALQRVTDLRAKLTRPLPGLGYRQYPRLREELTSLLGSITRPLAAPTEPQKRRLAELRSETQQVLTEANTIVTGLIPDLNRRLGNTPHVVGGEVLR